MSDYRSVADAVAEEIRSGALRPGDRLPPQRTFARRHGIADSTATRVYRELARRGLTVGEVGRGTYVRAGAETAAPALTEPAAARVDLELNHSTLHGHADLLAEGLAPLTRPDILGDALRPVGAAGTPAAREAAVDLLARGGWRPDPGQVLFAGNGRQAVSAAVAALVPPGGRLGVEELTYPVIRTVAARLGVTLVPLAMDEAGLVPGAVEQAHRRAPLHAVYTQPTLHNPLSLTAPPARLAALAGVLTRLDLPVVEDAVWGFLHGELPPFAALLPERTVLVDSLSKRVAPGLTLGFLVAPPARTDALATSLRSGGWTPMRFALEVMRRWQCDGTADRLVADKRRDAAGRQALMARRLDGFDVRGDARAYHCWWRLPEGWRADTFVAAAARHGIAVAPAAAFAVRRDSAPHAVRLALASPPADVLGSALDTLAGIARSAPEDLLAD